MSDNGLRDLTPLVNPRSIAIIGATEDVRRVGGRPLVYLRRFAYPGAIYPVNPKYDRVGDLPCYRTVDSLPEAPDMAIVAVPASAVLKVVADCQAAGIPALTIYTSGFREMGGEGEALEAELRARAAAKGTIICGPNCQGVANLLDNMVANFSSTLGRDDVQSGPIAFIAQSGMFTGIMAAECFARGLGIGYLISSGNEAAADFADYVAHAAADPRIRVIAGYMEGMRDGDRLRAAARVARAHGKPIVLLKVGRGEEGARAAASHTGALAGRYEAYRAAFRQWGIIEADDIAELFDITEILALGVAPPAGPKLGILTNSGGIGVFCADKARELGFDLAEFAPDTVAGLRAGLPEFGSAANPVDITLQALNDAETVGAHLRHIARDDGVDAVLACFGVQMLNVEPLVAEIKAANALNEKPFVVGWMHGDPAGREALREAGVPTFDDPLRALKAVRACLRGTRPVRIEPAIGAVSGQVADIVGAVAAAGRSRLSEFEARAVLDAAGVPCAHAHLAETADAAVAAAESIGLPVVLKIDSPDIAHKTEIDGVALGLGTAAAVREAFDRIMARARAARPDARLNGVGVHQMLPPGVELIVGVNRDPVFGPVVLVGAGGVYVEVMADTVVRVAPVDAAEAEAMIRELRMAPILEGARGRPKADVAAAAEAIAAVSALAVAVPSIEELDINPLIVGAEGEGAWAADALIRLSET